MDQLKAESPSGNLTREKNRWRKEFKAMSKYRVNLNGKDIEVSLLEQSGRSIKFDVSGNIYQVELDNIHTESSNTIEHESSAILNSSGSVTSPLPGLIVKIAVKEKQEVKANQLLLTIEAMKMENNIFSPVSGKIKKIHVKQGQEVKNKELLISF
jgi:pyruvate carboxylase subunit B